MSRETPPVFWARQAWLPSDVERFLGTRLEAALGDPRKRTLLAWPAILGAPAQREAHPQGIPEARLLALAARMLKGVGESDPASAWERDRVTLPDTASRGATGWLPGVPWAAYPTMVSLRSGVALMALTGQPEDERYLLASGVTLFNCALFHECHDVLEMLWRRSTGELKTCLQGLILLASGYYHQQHHHAAGMQSLWKDGTRLLRPLDGTLETPWGRIAFSESLAMASRRLEWLKTTSADEDWARFWETPSPEWELT